MYVQEPLEFKALSVF